MTDVGGITAGQLRSYIERVERLEEEKAEIAATVREVFAEAKANGFSLDLDDERKISSQMSLHRRQSKEGPKKP